MYAAYSNPLWVRTIFSVENSRCFQGIFKDKRKNVKDNVPKHEISNFDQNFTIRERLRDYYRKRGSASYIVRE